MNVSMPIGQEVVVITSVEPRELGRWSNPTMPKPSILRRAKPCLLATPNSTSSTGASYSASQSQLSPASTGFIERNVIVTISQQQPEEHTTVQEIVLCEPAAEECEIMEVDESEFVKRLLQNLLQTDVPQVSHEIAQPPTVRQKVTKIKPKPEKKKPATEIKCLEKDCLAIVHNVIELKKHLQNDHQFNFEEQNLTFPSDEDFKKWKTSYERDRKVSFVYRGGTKKISAEKAITYLICHRSGYYKPSVRNPTERKRKLKPQGSCKIGTNCTAGIRLMKNLTTGVIDATICHTHYGHDNANIQHLRLNSSMKAVILDKLKEGFCVHQILEYVNNSPDELQCKGVVKQRTIKNIFDQCRKTNGDILRASTRIKQKEKLSVNPAQVKRGRDTGCPRKILVPASSNKPKPQPESRKTAGVMSASREEPLGIPDQLDNIHNAGVLKEVKKRICDSCAVSYAGQSGQI